VYCFGIIVWELITLEMPDLSQEFVPEVRLLLYSSLYFA
jgi:hypothetical protein